MRMFSYYGVIICLVMGVVMASGCQAIGKQSDANVVVESLSEDSGRWSIRNNDVEVVVDGPTGRIIKYGFIDAQSPAASNVFWRNEKATDFKNMMGGWENWGGDKIWPWPQQLFGWPPPEPSYVITPREDGKGLVMTGELPRFNVRIIRNIELEPQGSTLVVTSQFQPLGLAFIEPLAVWSITQVPTPRELYVRIPLAGDRRRYMQRKVDDGFAAREVGQNVVRLLPRPQGGKTFMDADVQAAVYNDVVLIQRLLPIHTSGVYAQDERAQIYFHNIHADNIPPGPSYVELEWTAPILPTQDIDKAPLRVIYKLVRIKPDTSEEDIVNMIQALP